MNVRPLLATVAVVLAMLVPASGADVTVLPTQKGMKVWYAEDHSIPVIALVASFHAGSAYDPHGKSGLAALAASLFSEGAAGFDDSAFAAALSDHGIRLSADSDRDVMKVSMVTLSSSAREAFRLMGLALAKPRFDADDLTRTRIRLLQGIENDRRDAEYVAQQGFFSLYFGPYTYGRAVEGDQRGLDAVTVQDLRAFARTHWVRGGLNVVIAGDLDKTEMPTLLRSAFGALPAQEPEMPLSPVLVGAPGVHVLAMDAPQSAIVFGEPGMLPGNRSYFAGMLANYILGGSETSRLMEELKEKRSLTYGVSTSFLPFRRAGIVMGEVSTSREDVQQALVAVRETMRKFASEGPTDDELADAKAHINSAFTVAAASYEGLAKQLNELQQQGLSPDYLYRRLNLISAVSADDVRRAAGQMFDPKRLTIVVAGTPAEEKDTAGGQ